MVVYVSNNVKSSLRAYRNALRKYPISRARALEKYNKMVDALLSLGNNLVNCRPCVHKDLGQLFDNNGNPIYKNLFRYNYQDESKYTWAFGVLVDEVNDKITIITMLGANIVKESLRIEQKIRYLTETIVSKVFTEVKRRMLNEGKYKVVGFDEEFDYGNGKKGNALMTLSDGYGTTRVIEDDGCYVAYQKVGDGYVEQTHIFPELFNAMVDYLPKLHRQ